MGKPLYEAFGYVAGRRRGFEAGTPQREEGRWRESERWKELDGEVLPFALGSTWRSVGGRIDGSTVKPLGAGSLRGLGCLSI